MIELNVTATNIAVSGVETLTSGRVGLKCAFTFSGEWNGLQKVATFVGSQKKSVPVDSNEVTIPWECFVEAENYRLTVAVKGTKPDGTVVLPTVYAVIGKIQRGAESAEAGADPTPSVVAQIQQNAANALAAAQSVRADADAGVFKGAKGDKGDTGDPGEDGSTVSVSASGTATDEVQYITIDGVEKKLAVSGKEDSSNKVTSLSSSSTDTQYPSAKCVYDLVGNVEAAINTIRGVS